ncbi:hypothetical protein RB195_012467 [Necator americanus]|uniref:Tudor domain-containing protein n=1 Tax=Necator americanus TaxID=51031 RepID=A0ABR1D8E7_NECAM
MHASLYGKSASTFCSDRYVQWSAFSFFLTEPSSFVDMTNDLRKSEGSEESSTTSASTASCQKWLGGNNWAPSRANEEEAPASPKYPVFDENQLRRQCQDSIQKKSPRILIERLKQGGVLLWSELSVLERRLVDCNPWFFEVSIDLPEFVERRVKLINGSKLAQIDINCKNGGLRPALDEDLAWLPDANIVYPIHKFSIREISLDFCAVIAFTPPRCFIMCVKDDKEEQERLSEVSDGLRDIYTKYPRKKGEIEIRPGVALVGVINDVLMRVVVLEADVRKPTKVRCACMDYNAIYSFNREDLFPLPSEFSPQKVPVNIFLGRFRGTHYIFKNKYVEANNAMCQPNKDEGMVSFVTCAIYGAAPDGLTIVDATMPDDNGWVSSVMIRARIAAPMAGDPDIRCSAVQAEAAIRQFYSKGRHSASERESVADPNATHGRFPKPKNKDVCGEDKGSSEAYVAKFAKDDRGTLVNKTAKEGSTTGDESQRHNVTSSRGSTDSGSESTEKNLKEASLIAKNEEQQSKTFQVLEEGVLTATDKSDYEGTSGVQEQANESHPEDEIKEIFGYGEDTHKEVKNVEERIHELTIEELSEKEKDQLADLQPKKMVEELHRFSANRVENEEETAKLDTDLLTYRRMSETVTSAEVNTVPDADVIACAASPSTAATPLCVPTNEAEVGTYDVEVEDLYNVFEAYITARRLSGVSPSFKAAVDFFVISAMNSGGRMLIGKDSISSNADEQTVIADLNMASELAFKSFTSFQSL